MGLFWIHQTLYGFIINRTVFIDKVLPSRPGTQNSYFFVLEKKQKNKNNHPKHRWGYSGYTKLSMVS